ncbi:MAG: hypothetical protein FWC42_08340 [Proteobacteria bacterium]|nr:hypothetical protein [Pseudomonadota bacterium]
MSSENRPIGEVVNNIKAAIKLLESAEHEWPNAMQDVPQAIPEASQLEELLHCATHETSSTLAFLVRDIETLFARIRIRQEFAVFATDQVNRIVESGWSVGLVQEIHQQLPALSLPELSAQIKRLCSEWSDLPKVAFKRRL